MVEQIKKLCSDNKTSIKALEKELGFGNGTIRRWDTNAPSVEKIILVANKFNVPVSLITGNEEQKEKSPTVNGRALTPENYKIAYSEMSAADLYAMLSEITQELQGREKNET